MDFADHIFVPTDFSEASDAALSAATTLAHQLGAKITLFHCFDSESLVPPLSIDPDSYRRNIEEEVRDKVEARLNELREKKLSKVENVELRIGSERGAAASICSHAALAHADMIIMATHGRTGLKHMLIGSVAEKVVRHAHCAVLVVRQTVKHSD